MSTTGDLLEPLGPLKEKACYENFKEQAGILANAGVHGFIVETILDLKEALCALSACRDNFNLPVILSMAFTTVENGGRTIMGNRADECALKLFEAGADIIGTNCGDLDPFQMAEIVAILQASSSLPVLVQPNAGRPELVNNKTVFKMGPHDFARGIEKCVQAGATIVGGCCGTTPEHIRLLAKVLGK
jgi:5-methyltetrahydrofolate--homocysteine methyltransferase